MKENSREEDIEILEKNVKSVKENSDMAFFETDEDYYFFKAVEHILSDYKRLLNENKEVKDLIAHKNEYTKKLEKDLFENCNNYVIPVQKVKDVLNKINQEYIKQQEKLSMRDYFIQKEAVSIMQELKWVTDELQKLIEEREEK